MNRYLTILLVVLGLPSQAQTRINPVIKSAGTVWDVPFAIERPDPSMVYNIVIEAEREGDRPDTINWALNNVARLVNLHASAGVPRSNTHIVVAIHGGAAYSVMNNESYREKFKKDNPNLKVLQELKEAGVSLFICSQSLMARKIDRNRLVPEVVPAVSMLTVLTTYQLKGYAMLKF
jgi:intracellular sulfur oxidation DsrE/DsrF family protein